LEGATTLSPSLTLHIANGAKVVCDTQLVNAQWHVQGYQFSTDLKILCLNHYDMIIGYDWLEEFSPMRLHWRDKWMTIPYQTGTMVIHGVSSSSDHITEAQVCQLLEEDLNLDVDDTKVIDQVTLPEIQHMMSVYAKVFASKVYFPLPGSVVTQYH
jgi:hypothetical protein